MIQVFNCGHGFKCKRTRARYQVKKTEEHNTKRDRLSGRVEHGSKPGPAPYLTEDEEAELAKFLIEVSEIGYGKTKQEVIMIVQKTLKKK